MKTYLACKQNHTPNAMGQRALDCEDEHDGVDSPEDKEESVDADVKESGRARVVCLIHLERERDRE